MPKRDPMAGPASLWQMAAHLRLLLVLMMTFTLFVRTGTSVVLYACSMSGEVGTSCCCDPAEDDAPSVGAASNGCCDIFVVSTDTAESPFDGVPSLAEVVAIAPTAPNTWPDRRASLRLVAPAPPRGPPNPRVPTYIENCAFLI